VAVLSGISKLSGQINVPDGFTFDIHPLVTFVPVGQVVQSTSTLSKL